MIDILYLENKEQLSLECSNLIESLIGDSERNKASRYRRWQDKQAYLLGKFLTARLLEKYGYSYKLLKRLDYTEFKRPYIKEAKIDFNISHSGEFVVCAFSAVQKVGVDIEQIQYIDLKDFYHILNNGDKEIIDQSQDKYRSFFKIWSAKEAILKAHGCGLVNDLHTLKIHGDTGFFDDTEFYLKELNIHPLYSSCIASSVPVETINIEKIADYNCLESFK